jgi:hypothetical protein
VRGLRCAAPGPPGGRSGAAAVDIRPEVEAAGDRGTQARFAGTAWTGCRSWYRTGTGRNVANWPGCIREYARRTRRVDPADYVLIRGGSEKS